MANTDRAYGFEPTGIMYGLQPFTVDVYQSDGSSTPNTATFRNDLMEIYTRGNAAPAAAGSVNIVGSAQSVTPGNISTAAKALIAASTDSEVLVSFNPNQMYWAQDDGLSDTSAQADLGGNANHIAGSGSTATGISAHEIDIDTQTNGAAGIRLLDFVKRDDNTAGANADWMCLINEHTMSKEAGI
jgi:hypothetical protein